MVNFELHMVLTHLNWFKLKKILIMVLADKIKLYEIIITFCIWNNSSFYSINPKINIPKLIKQNFIQKNKDNYENENITFFKYQSLKTTKNMVLTAIRYILYEKGVLNFLETYPMERINLIYDASNNSYEII